MKIGKTELKMNSGEIRKFRSETARAILKNSSKLISMAGKDQLANVEE